jgi:hypothetical protein
MLGWAVGAGCQAESPDVVVRLITAPGAGAFVPGECQPTTPDGVPITAGDPVGLLVRLGGTDPIRSPFTGVLRGLMALPGERVRRHQPLAWITVADEDDGDGDGAARQDDGPSVRAGG